MIYIDQTNTINQSFTTGIPRVSRTVARLASNGKAKIICFGKDGYFHSSESLGIDKPRKKKWRKILEETFKVFLSFTPFLYRLIQEKYLSRQLSKLGEKSVYLDHQKLQSSTIILPEIPTRQRARYLISNSNKLDLKIIFWVYDLLPYTHPEYFKKTSILQISAFEDLLRASTKIVVNSRHVRSEIFRLFPEIPVSKISVIPLPSSFETHLRKEQNSQKVKSFSMIGSLEPRKNHLLAVKGFLKFRREFPESELNFVYNNSWKSWKVLIWVLILKGTGKKIFLRKNLSDFEVLRHLEESTALLFLSFEEGYGLPIVEALSIGIPVIMFDKPPMSEFAEFGGIIWCEDTSSSVLKSMLFLSDEIQRKETISHISLPESLQNWDQWWSTYERQVLESTSK